VSITTLEFCEGTLVKNCEWWSLTDTQLGYLDGQDKECECSGDILRISRTLNARLVFRYIDTVFKLTFTGHSLLPEHSTND
jgi:hypothetical protein